MHNQPLSWVVGGEPVRLRVNCQIISELHSPIIGFYVKDKLGQELFGDNTYLAYREHPQFCPANTDLQADFVFNMPLLPAGEYSITVAIANGSQEVHEQHHWIHDAVMFRSEASSIVTGLIGIPMLEIQLNNSELTNE